MIILKYNNCIDAVIPVFGRQTRKQEINLCWSNRSSWRKSPANMIENPPKGLILFPIFFSFTSSVPRFLSLMNDTSSTMRIHTSCHVFFLLRLSAFCWLRNAAFDIVIPPNNDAAAPVYAVNKNVLSFYHSTSTWHPLLSKSHNKTAVLPSWQCSFRNQPAL